MGKRYFCDYCDRSFQDNLHNRKKHLNGLQHLKAKKVWYDMFRGGCPLPWASENIWLPRDPTQRPSSCSTPTPQGPLGGWLECEHLSPVTLIKH